MIDIGNTIISFDEITKQSPEIYRNLKSLYCTASGTVPLDRNLGLDISFLGYPLEVAKNMYALEIIEKTEEYEPRVQVDDITFNLESDTLIPIIKLKMRSGEQIE